MDRVIKCKDKECIRMAGTIDKQRPLTKSKSEGERKGRHNTQNWHFEEKKANAKIHTVAYMHTRLANA